MGDQEAYETAFTINNNRNNLNDHEQGRWFKIMLEKFPISYPTQEALAPHVGVSQQHISRLIASYEFRCSLNAKSSLKEDANTHGCNGKDESTREDPKAKPKPKLTDANANSQKPKDESPPEPPEPPYAPPERAVREIRAAPSEFQARSTTTSKRSRLSTESTA
jgi:hypothetical protein